MVPLEEVFAVFQEGSFYLASFLFVLSVVVFVHEYGHYVVAKLCGVRVEAFSLGFGPELLGVSDSSGTRWRLSLVPLGGYVKMFGDAVDEHIDEVDRPYAFNEKPLLYRFLIAFAGPFSNLLFAVAVFFVLFSTRGLVSPLSVVGHVLEGSTAEKVGIREGDRIVAVNGQEVTWFEEIRHHITANRGGEVVINFLRGDRKHSVRLTPDMWSSSSWMLGIAASPSLENSRVRPLTLPHAASESVRCVYRLVRMTFAAVLQLVTGTRGISELGGPVRIAKYSGESIRNKEVLWFIGLISTNLGVINLLPVPILDGGHMLQYLLQGIFRRKRVGAKFQGTLVALGFVLLLSLMVFVTLNDIRSMLK